MTDKLRFPPKATNWEGDLRQVGVEIEFAAISAQSAAQMVKEFFGGEITKIGAHRYQIRHTKLGTFRSELDSRYLHRSEGPQELMEDETPAGIFDQFREGFRELLGSISAVVVPCEIVCPPVRVVDLARIDELVSLLTDAGALGTSHNPLYAFGAQLNPDIAARDASYVVSILKAYLLSSDLLRRQIGIDLTRRILSFADPFPIEYAVLVLGPKYWPNMDKLIDDYLAYNATRNRELDMLPLFAWMNENRIFKSVCDQRINKRPTFHYRLPNAQLGDPNWNIAKEWNRWCAVEYLAEDRNRLAQMADAFQSNNSRFLPDDWATIANQWINTPWR